MDFGHSVGISCPRGSMVADWMLFLPMRSFRDCLNTILTCGRNKQARVPVVLRYIWNAGSIATSMYVLLTATQTAAFAELISFCSLQPILSPSFLFPVPCLPHFCPHYHVWPNAMDDDLAPAETVLVMANNWEPSMNDFVFHARTVSSCVHEYPKI